MTLTDDNLTVTNNCSSYSQQGNAFGTRICNQGVYQWKFKLNKVNSGLIVIGVWRIQEDKLPPTEVYFTNGNEQGYGYYLAGEKLDTTTGYSAGTKYGKKCKVEDIVHMTLDLNEMTLSFKVNDVDYGVAFDNIKQAKYRKAVWLFHKYDSVSIIE